MDKLQNLEAQPTLKRISLLIREEQYDKLSALGLNLSGLVRDLLDDYLSDHKITLAVGEETRQLYDRIVANTGSADSDVEQYFRDGLARMLQDKIQDMQTLARQIKPIAVKNNTV